MSEWAAQNWHVLWAVGSGGLLLALFVYARRDPAGRAMAFWQRLKYAAFATAVFSSICLLAMALFLPNWVTVAMPYLAGVLFVLAWFAAPILEHWLPLKRSKV